MTSSNPIVFYDIASGPPRRTFAPNPWKTRYALNFKGVHYRTQWVEMPDISSVRKQLGPAPNRVLPNGEDFYTLPIIQDPSNENEVVGDSFDIAVYLDKTYPAGPVLLPPSSVGAIAALNVRIDALFTQYAILPSHGMPLNPDNADQVHREFERRFNVPWAQMCVTGDARTELFAKLKSDLGDLTKAYKHFGGPFLEGETATYADIIIGAWLAMFKECLDAHEWDEISSWHDGHWGELNSGLDKYTQIR